VSVGLEALILDCLAKNPDDRPSAEEARSRLEAEIPSASATQAQPAAPVTAATSVAASPPPSAGRPSASAVRPKQRRGLLAALALLAVLVVIGALAAPNLLGTGGDQNAQQNNAQVDGNGGQPDGGAGGNGGQGGGDQGGGVSPSASASASASSGGSPPSQDNSGQREFTAQAAEQTVGDFYASSSAGKYDKSARLLSEDYRQNTFPDRATFEGTFGKVDRVAFIEGPNAKISGNKAIVTGETQATLTREIQHNKGTWYLVQEDGRWKIDGWDVVQLSSRSV